MWKYRRLRRNKRGSAAPLKGFMLLEVVLSVFIVAVCTVFIIGSFITSIKAFKTSKLYLDALYLIEDKMWEYNESGTIDEGTYSGRFEDYKDAEWGIEAEELDDFPLNKVTAEIILKAEDDKEQRFRVATYLRNKE